MTPITKPHFVVLWGSSKETLVDFFLPSYIHDRQNMEIRLFFLNKLGEIDSSSITHFTLECQLKKNFMVTN